MKEYTSMHIIFLLALMTLASCAGTQKLPIPKADKPEISVYPSLTVKAIEEATFAQAVLLKAPPDNSGGIPAPETMEIAEDGRPFTSAELASLKAMLLSESSYITESVRKCVFLATWSLTFIGPGETAATIYVSRDCKQVKAAGESMAAEEIDSVADALFALIEGTIVK